MKRLFFIVVSWSAPRPYRYTNFERPLMRICLSRSTEIHCWLLIIVLRIFGKNMLWENHVNRRQIKHAKCRPKLQRRPYFPHKTYELVKYSPSWHCHGLGLPINTVGRVETKWNRWFVCLAVFIEYIWRMDPAARSIVSSWVRIYPP